MENTLEKAKSSMPIKGFLDIKDIAIPQGQDLVDAILKLKEVKLVLVVQVERVLVDK